MAGLIRPIEHDRLGAGAKVEGVLIGAEALDLHHVGEFAS
jgi:hypothetical protein